MSQVVSVDELRLRIRLTRKLADSLDGVDLSAFKVGDCIELSPRIGRTLILEGWAELVDPSPVERPVARPVEPPATQAPEDEPDP